MKAEIKKVYPLMSVAELIALLEMHEKFFKAWTLKNKFASRVTAR